MTAARKPRTRKTPEQRAREAVELAERALTRSTAALAAHDALRGPLEAAAAEARRRLDYAQQDPALQQAELPQLLDDGCLAEHSPGDNPDCSQRPAAGTNQED